REVTTGDTPPCTAGSSRRRLPKISHSQRTNGGSSDSYKQSTCKSLPMSRAMKHSPTLVFNHRYKKGRWHLPVSYSKSPKWSSPKTRVRPFKRRQIEKDPVD
ncbi:unnamed protein product, partial [Lymnaea stagnalis]